MARMKVGDNDSLTGGLDATSWRDIYGQRWCWTAGRDEEMVAFEESPGFLYAIYEDGLIVEIPRTIY